MISESADVAVLGAGFAGSLMALVLKRIGRRPILIEKGTHPRFAIGESSTPSANLVLEQICQRHDLPRLAPLAKYGRWQKSYPHIACGVKRGFSFFKHTADRPFEPTVDHRNELLVGANPSEDEADTHWFREHVDQFFADEAVAAGVPYFDRTEITALEPGPEWRLIGQRDNQPFEVRARFVIDATGPSNLVCRALGISTAPDELATNSWSVYSHFTGVAPWADVLEELGSDTTDHPYPCDAAALHHMLDDGWIWVLRFNNGVTSAGVAFNSETRPPTDPSDAETLWPKTLSRYPSIARQFAGASAIRPFTKTSRMQRRAARIAGPNWALLPHAAYFLDPLFSGGNAHTLLGIGRLADILEAAWDTDRLPAALADYERQTFGEITFLDRLIHGCYRTLRRFDLMAPFTMYYFAGAIQSEIAMRAGQNSPGFLWSGTPEFRSAVERSYDRLTRNAAADGNGDGETRSRLARELHEQVAADIASYNPAGLCDAAKRNMYPFI